jgi:hypothetical protein
MGLGLALEDNRKILSRIYGECCSTPVDPKAPTNESRKA